MVLALAGCDGVFGITHVPDPKGGGVTADGAADAGRPIGCPIDYNRSIDTSLSYYRVVQSKKTWQVAAADCGDDMPGMTHLIVPSNQAELTAIIINPSVYLNDDTWIGATALKNGSFEFLWVTDEDTGGFIVPTTKGMYPWESGEPSSGSGCGELRGKQDSAVGGLHDEDCQSGTPTSFYICECDGLADVPSHYQ